MAINKPTPQPQGKAGGVGLGLDNFVEGGGLFDDFDGTIVDALFVRWDYNGQQEVQLALALEIRNDEEDVSEEEKKKNPFVQYYSAGKLEHFIPSDDGSEAVPVGGKTGLSKSCNAYHLLASAIQAGFDQPFGSSCKVLVGHRFHFKRKEIERDFGSNRKKEEKKDADKKNDRKSHPLLCETYLGVEGAQAAGPKPGPRPGAAAGPGPKPVAAGPGPRAVPSAATGRPAPATPPPPPAASPANGAAMPDELTTAWASAYILETLEANGGVHPKAGLAKGVLPWAKNQKDFDIPTRNKVIQALGNDAWLATGGGQDLIDAGSGWTFDGETLTANS